jgi:hypothetical protein
MRGGSDFAKLTRFVAEVALFAVATAALWFVLTLPYRRMLADVGEGLDGSGIARASRSGPILWLHGLLDSGSLKTEAACTLCPDVAAFGSSRVMQLREEMFRRVRPHGFYNLGGDMSSVTDARLNLRRLVRSGCRPKLILLGLDWWWFQTDGVGGDLRPSSPLEARREALHLLGREVVRAGGRALDEVQLVQRAWRDRRFWEALHRNGQATPRLLGLAAGTGGGYRNDGSFRYPPRAAASSLEALRAEPLQRLRSGLYRGNAVSPAALQELERFLADCRHDGIAVVAFTPPMESGILAFFRAAPESARFWREFATTVGAACARHQTPFHDFSDVTSLGVAADGFVDWFHAGERACALIIAALAQDPLAGPLVAPYVDEGRLHQDLSHPRSAVALYPEG